MAEKVDNKKIAKNTVILYIRMVVTMAVGIFTSRITLEYLGITDYGIYQSVGGIVGLVAFTNTAISTGISRFITFGLGEDNPQKLRRTFSTILTIQIVFILVIVLIAETVGYWFITHKLVIPAGLMNAAIFAYHVSIFTVALGMLTNPFSAMISAHERFKVYAYISLVTTFATLGIAYLLQIIPTGRLYLYAGLLFLISLGSLSFQIFYSCKNFAETTFKLSFDKSIFREIAGFSGWSMFAALSIALNNQGVLVLLNMFFAPAVVAARAVSLTVYSASSQLVANFRTAMNPQIVKQYAAGNYEISRKLLLTSTKISFFLMLLLSVPIFYMAGPLLGVWLKKVPNYSDIFLKLVIIQALFQVFDTSFYMALYAKGRLKENALLSPLIGFLSFPITYILFKLGASPVALSWVTLVSYAVLGIIIKPILIVKIVDYKWTEILTVLGVCLKVALIAYSLGYIITRTLYHNTLIDFFIVSALCVIITAVVIYSTGLSKDMRQNINQIIKLLFVKG